MRLRVILATGLAVAAVIAVVVVGIVVQSAPPAADAPLAVAGADQPGATTAACQKVMQALPTQLSGSARRALVVAEPGVAAWGDPAVIVRCGMPTPNELTCSSALTVVNRVSWLRFPDLDRVTYLAVDRQVRISVSLPDTAGTGPLQALADLIDSTLPARPVCTAGVLTATDS